MSIGPRPCELRAATEADRDAIAEVWHASASLPGVGPAVMPTMEAMRREIERELDLDWTVTLAVRDGLVAGFVAMRPAEGVIAELFVRPEAIGEGIGRALLDHAKEAMPGGFTLYTRPANRKARRFYERAGLAFLRDGVHPRTGEPVVHYEWRGR